MIIALAVSLSFILTNLIYQYALSGYNHFNEKLRHFETEARLSEDAFLQPCNAPVVVVGMGRVGLGAYHALHQQIGDQVWGLDADRKKCEWLTSQDYQAFYGDAEDAFFWENIDLNNIQLILLALPTVKDCIGIYHQLKVAGYQGKIAAIARFDDERVKLEKIGIDKVFNFYTEAGVGFAKESIELYQLH